jgi:hypothetical protein
MKVLRNVLCLAAVAAVLLVQAPLAAAEPSPPSPCYVNGQSDSVVIGTYYPRFSATYHDTEDCGVFMHVEVGTDTNWTVAEIWNSSWVAISAVQDGKNSHSIVLPITNLQANTSYYWRVRFMDEASNDGQWSADQVFSTGGTLTTRLEWDASARATGYHIHFDTAANPSYNSSTTDTFWDPGTLEYDTSYYWKVIAYNATGNSSTTIWEFRTTKDVPTNPFNPNPNDLAQNVGINSDLSWDNSARAEGYYVYFGTSVTPPYISTVTPSAFDPGAPMSYDTTYYWKVIAYNSGGNSAEVSWSFRTIVEAPVQAANPNPADALTDVAINKVFDWDDSLRATSYYVYFGTAADPAYNSSVALSTFDPGILAYDTQYYWKVIASNIGGNASTTIWSFRTCVAPGVNTLAGYFDTHTVPGSSFSNSSWGTNNTVHFTWDCSGAAAGFFWYFGSTVTPNPEDYAYTTNKYTESHTATAGTNYFYVMATDGVKNSSIASYVYLYDAAAPIPSGVHTQISTGHSAGDGLGTSGEIVAGCSSIVVDYDSIAEANPECTSFVLTVTGGTGSDEIGDETDTNTPTPQQFTGLVLNGGSKLIAKVTHYDKAGRSGYADSAEYFVKPYTPPAPSVAQISGNWSALDVNVQADASENTDITYAIYCDTLGLYVQADGSLGASAVWQNDAAWGTKRVTGLSGETAYNFSTKSRNILDNAVESAMSAQNSASTVIEPPEAPQSPAPPDGASGVPIE